MRQIDADELMKVFERNVYADFFGGEFVRKAIEDAPTIEPKRGKWIAVEYNDGTVHTECSVCGYGRGVPPVRNYCPNCGARMDG